MPSRQNRTESSHSWRQHAAKCVCWLTVANVASTFGLWYLIWEISETHWLGSVVTFLPRLPWLFPGTLLLIASLLIRSKTFWGNLATTAFALLAITGFNVPWNGFEDTTQSFEAEDRTLRIVSCNVQNFSPDFNLVLREVHRAKPDVLVLQEAFRPPPLLREHFEGWHQIHIRGFWVASKWPVRLLGECQTDVFSHPSGVVAEIEAPFGAFALADVHLMTARKSLIELRPRELLSGDGQLALAAATVERMQEAQQVREFIDQHSMNLPLLVVGDFNMPTSSSIYRANFGELANAFEATSWGCGYTAPCKRFGRWPANTPWQRIDHILTDSQWTVRETHIGETDGSDHRLVAATLRLRGRKSQTGQPHEPLVFGGDSGDLRRGASR